MTKVRFFVSLEEELAARIRDIAVERGENVSALVTRAATELVQREERKREVFAGLDAEIAAAESGEDVTGTGRKAPEGHRVDTSETPFWDDFFEGATYTQG